MPALNFYPFLVTTRGEDGARIRVVPAKDDKNYEQPFAMIGESTDSPLCDVFPSRRHGSRTL
jgi:hypothetical protein